MIETFGIPPAEPEPTIAPIDEANAADVRVPTARVATRKVASASRELAVVVLAIGAAALLGVTGVAGLYVTRRQEVEYDDE